MPTENPTPENETNYKSQYDKDTRSIIRKEAFYLFFLLILSVATVLCLLGFSEKFNLSFKDGITLSGALISLSAGLMGSTVYGFKTFCTKVSDGQWSPDKNYWRYSTPLASACVALIVSCMVFSGFIDTEDKENSIALMISIGFFAGYFADKAVGKMSDVASVLFGHSSTKPEDSKSKDTPPSEAPELIKPVE